MQKYMAELEKNKANYIPLSPISFLNRSASIFPERTAIIYNERSMNWREFHARCHRFASALINHGLKKGDVVSVLATNTPEMMELHFSVPISGGVLNAINYRLEASSIAYILDHSEAKFLVIDRAFAPMIKQAFALMERPQEDITIIDIIDLSIGPMDEIAYKIGNYDYEGFLALGDADYIGSGPDDEWDALALNYTSGTSGKPKGVVYHHRGSYLMSMGTVTGWGLTRHPTYLYCVPLFHCNGWGHVWTMALLTGTIICLRAIVAKDIFTLVNRHKVTHFGGAPTVLTMLIAEHEKTPFQTPHKVNLMTAGAPPPAIVIEKINAMGFEVMQVYGLTETYGHVTQALPHDDWQGLDSGALAERQSWQGVAFPMTEAADVVNSEDGMPIAKDSETQGEIVIRGNTVMKGYYRDQKANEVAFKHGWFYSGDGAVWHENGYIQIKDRLKDVIISGGENISSVEVESVLYRHPAVSFVGVVAKPDEKWGEVPCAFIELKQGASVTQEELDQFCRKHLAGFKRPKAYQFMELPKTATGKIQKFVLRQKAKTL